MIGVNLARNTLAALGRLVCSESAISDINFFFSTAALGGAEKVHAGIVQAVSHPRATVFFSEKAKASPLLADFARHARIEDISDDTAGRMRFYMRIGSVAAAINAQAAPVVFGGFSYFFYRLLPRLQPHVRCIDLLHNFGGGFERLGLENVQRLNQRVFISFRTFNDVLEQYRSHGVEQKYAQRMQVIENCCDVPTSAPHKIAEPFRVIFVGRGSPEKRIHLAGKIATAVKAVMPAAAFTFVGDVENWVHSEDRKSCQFTGPVHNADRLRKLYAESHCLLLTSDKEGFPLVVMEAMANGCIPLCTDVGGISFRVRSSVNGLLIDPHDETKIVSAMAAELIELAGQREKLSQMSAAAFATADKFFRRERFNAAYRALLLGEPGPPGYPVTQVPVSNE